MGAVWLLTVCFVVFIERSRIEEFGWLNLLVLWNSETTLPLFALLLLPALALLLPARRTPRGDSNAGFLNLRSVIDVDTANAIGSDQDPDGSTTAKAGLSKIRLWWVVQSLAIALCSLFASWCIGQTEIEVRTASGEVTQFAFAGLPPAYHDEFSYLLQAETFAAKRLAWPRVEVVPDLFHQFHVLNEDVTISRYFPLTGLWIVPGLMLGHPIWGHWLAGAMSAVLFFWSARLIMSSGPAFFCGLLIAFSPALAMFSNMLLAHHPVMLMLSVFLFAFLKLIQPWLSARRQTALQSFAWALIAGCGLAAAMLGRPMTAAGFAAPFGAWLLCELVRRRTHMIAVLGFAVPLICGFCVLAMMNSAATGDPFRTAYQEYTDNFTPRHKYGFDNAVNCEIGRGPAALKQYDQWATNLDSAAALKNVQLRTKFSLFWTWNLVLLTMGLIAAIVELVRLLFVSKAADRSIGLATVISFRITAAAMLLAAIVSLHIVHIPYWYSGIMEWHYVFETAPLILLLAGFGLFSFLMHVQSIVRPTVAAIWMCGLILVSTIPAWFSSPDLLGASKVDQWINQTAYSRRRIAEFDLAVSSVSAQQPVLILVDESGTDPQLSFIINPPDYSGPSLVCRIPRSRRDLADLKATFPDRKLFYFDASQGAAMIRPFDESVDLSVKP